MESIGKLQNILFFDIETVAEYSKYDALSDKLKQLWEQKSKFFRGRDELTLEDSYTQKAGIYAEFAKVVCISVGYVSQADTQQWQFRYKSFASENEAELLIAFADLLEEYFYDPRLHGLCGHNIREFDVPFICRRLTINGLEIPRILDTRHAKPWEREHLLDTMQSWKYGDYKHYTSLDLLCHVLNVKSPKSEMSGSEVHRYYYENADHEAIQQYCESDIMAVFEVYARLHHYRLPENLEYIHA